MIRTFAAAIFILLTATASARAAYVNEIINISYGNGYTSSGEIAFNVIEYPLGFPPTLTPAYLGYIGLDLNGVSQSPGAWIPLGSGSPPFLGIEPELFTYQGQPCGPGGSGCNEVSYDPFQLPTTYADFFLNGAEGPSVRKRTLRKASEGHFGGSGA